MSAINALDTNILARFFINDKGDPEASKQKKIVAEIMLKPSYVSLTVVIEFFWVMRMGYKLPKETCAEIMTTLCDLSHITIEHENYVRLATKHFLQGMDFADALHHAQIRHCQRFYTFDKKFINKANKLELQPKIVEPT